MAILSQILGQSFGRGPMQGLGDVHAMAGLPQAPRMHPPSRAEFDAMHGGGAAAPPAAAPPQGPADAMAQFRDAKQALPGGPGKGDAIDALRQQFGLGGAGHGGVGPEAGVPHGMGNDAGLPGLPGVPAAGGGMMNSIMQAFNGGAGGVMDPTKLMQLASMFGAA